MKEDLKISNCPNPVGWFISKDGKTKIPFFQKKAEAQAYGYDCMDRYRSSSGKNIIFMLERMFDYPDSRKM